MSDPVIQLEATLKTSGQSVTQPRLMVFKALQEQEPLTMQQVVAACSPAVDRASVYRTITLFERLGIVQRLQIGWKYKIELSDAFHRHHHHLTCTHCGRTIALDADAALEDRLHQLAEAKGFIVQEHQIEIQGLCANCAPA